MSKHVKLNSQFPEEKINIQNILKKHAVLVKFYSDTCGYCQDMRPEWDHAMNRIQNKNPKNLIIIEVESNNITNFEDGDMIKSKVMGFPTIMYLNKKKNNKVEVIPYNGSRTSPEIVDFTFKNLKKSSKINLTKKNNKRKKGKKNKRKTSKRGKKNNKK